MRAPSLNTHANVGRVKALSPYSLTSVYLRNRTGGNYVYLDARNLDYPCEVDRI